MSYTTGSAANIAAVKTALVNAATAAGWTSATDSDGKTVLSKSGVYVRVDDTTDEQSNPALDLLGRTALESGPAPSVVSMRSMGSSTAIEAITFPATYHIFTFTAAADDADEVYCIINYGSTYQWCAFGKSLQAGMTGTGAWVAATSGYGTPDAAIYLTSTGAGNYTGGDFTSAALFLTSSTSVSRTANRNGWVHTELDASYPWSLAYGANDGTIVGVKAYTELFDAQPNAMTGEGVFLPVRAYKSMPSTKYSQVLELLHCRHVRIDNYNDEQIITLGTDQWMVFPWYKKSLTEPNGGSGKYHTGTFGWALRYA